MTDYFAMLQERRRPWIEPELLKQKFHALSAAQHPDRVHGESPEARESASQRFVESNAAYNCLREPRSRVRHLLELERGAKVDGVRQIPAELMDASMEISQLCREVDGFLADQAKTLSPLVKVKFFAQGEELRERVLGKLAALNVRRESLLSELKEMNPFWDEGGGDGERGKMIALGRLEEIQGLLGYYNRWAEQLQERNVRLTTF